MDISGVSFKPQTKGIGDFIRNLFGSSAPAPAGCNGGGDAGDTVTPGSDTPIILEESTIIDILETGLPAVGDRCALDRADANAFYREAATRLIGYYKNGNFIPGTIESQIQTRLLELGVEQEYLVVQVWTTTLATNGAPITRVSEGYAGYCETVAADRNMASYLGTDNGRYGSITLTTTNRQLLEIINADDFVPAEAEPVLACNQTSMNACVDNTPDLRLPTSTHLLETYDELRMPAIGQILFVDVASVSINSIERGLSATDVVITLAEGEEIVAETGPVSVSFGEGIEVANVRVAPDGHSITVDISSNRRTEVRERDVVITQTIGIGRETNVLEVTAPIRMPRDERVEESEEEQEEQEEPDSLGLCRDLFPAQPGLHRRYASDGRCSLE